MIVEGGTIALEPDSRFSKRADVPRDALELVRFQGSGKPQFAQAGTSPPPPADPPAGVVRWVSVPCSIQLPHPSVTRSVREDWHAPCQDLEAR